MKLKIKVALVRLLQSFLSFIPVKKNRIMFYAHNRKGYVCNPAALMTAIQQKYPEEYELIWVTGFPESCEKREGITVVRQRSLEYFRYFIRTKYFVTNDMVDESLVKKRGQIFIDTWHGGGAYKKVGIGTIGEDEVFAENFLKWYGRLDYFLSSCQMCTDLYAKAFYLKPDIFLETGTPRNDIFFRKQEETKQKVRDFYHISPKTKIILFAPSFQHSAPEKEQYDRNVLQNVVEELHRKTKEDWVMLYRAHYYSEVDKKTEQLWLKDGNAYYEMQDLLYTADILVTDFSSCIWDFALTGRPIILMENRLAEYESEDRGFFVPYEFWPYIKIQDLSQLVDTILQYEAEDFSDRYAEHMQKMGSFETGSACEQVIDTIFRGEEYEKYER
ncbi:MAG: CDP-glycerol glycerophosphotransferase family protein [Butyribacter sp.]|nr:CDP-glycerol glycerophosphotransferase family protein [bacterium]MDY3854463.1 CDP-glycerol glycerophosphotransferase family protein [Butyribacter sp.]